MRCDRKIWESGRSPEGGNDGVRPPCVDATGYGGGAGDVCSLSVYEGAAIPDNSRQLGMGTL